MDGKLYAPLFPCIIVGDVHRQLTSQAHQNLFWEEQCREKMEICMEVFFNFLWNKLIPREITPKYENIKFLGTWGVELDVFKFKYFGGFFTVMVKIILNKNHEQAILVVETLEYIFPFHPGITLGHTYEMEKISTP
jgi:hypothetical protein